VSIIDIRCQGEHAFHSHDDVFPEGLYSIEKDLGVGINVPVQSDLLGFIQDTEIHFSGMKIDSAIKFVLFGVESHKASSFGLECDFLKRYFIMPQEEALNSIKATAADAKGRSVEARRYRAGTSPACLEGRGNQRGCAMKASLEGGDHGERRVLSEGFSENFGRSCRYGASARV